MGLDGPFRIPVPPYVTPALSDKGNRTQYPMRERFARKSEPGTPRRVAMDRHPVSPLSLPGGDPVAYLRADGLR